MAFGEAWLPGYPAWLDFCPNVAMWDHLPTKQVFARLRQNSITVPGPETTGLSEVAGDLKISIEPVYDREQLIIADLDLSEIDQQFLTLDVSGHYARPDVFTFDTKVK